MTTHHGRNEPCPCGSGRKFKQCCEGKLRLSSRVKSGGPLLWVSIAVGVVVIVALAVFMRPRNPGSPAPVSSAPAAPASSALQPNANANPGATVAATPWAYDPATNRHFDPGHNHWHDGPPPPAASRGAGATASSPITPVTPGATPSGLSASPIVPGARPSGLPVSPAAPGAPGSTPAPWTYDAAKNQHWDPTHNHWHQGPPPQQPR